MDGIQDHLTELNENMVTRTRPFNLREQAVLGQGMADQDLEIRIWYKDLLAKIAERKAQGETPEEPEDSMEDYADQTG